jgi:hypothetical protein
MMPRSAASNRIFLTREDVLDVREVGELLHLPLSTIFDYARRGVLPGRKLGRCWVFLRDELDVALRTAPRSEASRRAPQPPVSQRRKGAPSSGTRWRYCDSSGQQRLQLD